MIELVTETFSRDGKDPLANGRAVMYTGRGSDQFSDENISLKELFPFGNLNAEE